MRCAALALGLCAVSCAAVTGGAVELSSSSEARDYFVYVTAESSDEVYKVRFDGEEARIDRVIGVGYQPTEIEGPHGLALSPDGRHWFLSMAHGKPFGFVYKYATETDELLGRVELGLFPATMQVSEATGLLYCVNFDLHGDMSPSSVSIVDPDEMVEVGRTTTGPMPHGSRLSPDGLRHYSCSMMSGELFELDAVGFEVLRVLALSEKGSHGPEGSGSHGEMMQDPSKPTWVQPHPTLPLAYVCLNGADQIAEVDLERWEVSRRFSTGAGPYNLAITPDGHGLVATYKTEGTVGFWNLKTGEEFARIPSSRAVTHGVVLSANGRHAFVSSEGIGAESGALDVFDMNSAALIDTVELGLQAGGICFWKSEAR